MTSETYCPRDFNLGEEAQENFCNVGGLPCPEPKKVEPDKVVSVSCGPCGRRWGLPIGKVMKGKAQNFHQCVLSECAAVIEVPVPEVPAPVDDAPATAKKTRTAKTQ